MRAFWVETGAVGPATSAVVMPAPGVTAAGESPGGSGPVRVGPARRTPPSTSSGAPLAVTLLGEVGRTVDPSSERSPMPVTTAAAIASSQKAANGRAWFAFNVSFSPRGGQAANMPAPDGLPRPLQR